MYWILFIMAAIASLIAAIVVGGLATPRKHVVARRITLRAPQQAVWNVIRDVGRYADWRDDIQQVQLVDADQPGVTRWREVANNGSVTFGATEDVAPSRFTAVVLDDDLPWSGSWTWDVRRITDATTSVTITERGEVGNPIFRFIGTYLLGFTGTMDKYLAALALEVGDVSAKVEDGTSSSATA